MSDYNIHKEATVHLIIRLSGAGYPLLDDARLGIAAGGQIQQKIYKDKYRSNIYDEDARERVWIHIVSTDLWEVRIESYTRTQNLTPVRVLPELSHQLLQSYLEVRSSFFFWATSY